MQINSKIISKDRDEEQKIKIDNKRLSVISSKSVIGAKLDKEAQNDEMTSKFEAEQLTFDHSWDVDREQRRILEYGGRVDKVKLSWGVGGIGPLRVWFRHEEKPGLAMTRSIGDHVARNIGVISKPEILQSREIERNDYAIMMGSDGVFEYLSNQRIADICWRERMKTSQEIWKIIWTEAKDKWKTKSGWVDDITWMLIQI